ncbi:hypothetical protein BaRGS_00008029 [Batillaria attramentaria]|uniref:Uncharacterized protein n=1 Tax=Batillaria attramentaria TaxID=370345 RepID=A0ABD0LMW9_9CAEN
MQGIRLRFWVATDTILYQADIKNKIYHNVVQGGCDNDDHSLCVNGFATGAGKLTEGSLSLRFRPQQEKQVPFRQSSVSLFPCSPQHVGHAKGPTQQQ